jgi:hypothetical protein
MINLTTIRLNEALYCERLQAANAARRWRATSVVAPSSVERLRQALGQRLISLGQQMQGLAAPANI